MGQVFEEQLFLKIFGIGGYNDAAAVLRGVVNGRGEIGHGFAHACARFGDEELVVVEGIGNGAYHFDLFGANFIAFGLSVKCAAGFKQGAEHVAVEGFAVLCFRSGFFAAHIGQGEVICATTANAAHKFAFGRFIAQIDKDVEQGAICALQKLEDLLFGAE